VIAPSPGELARHPDLGAGRAPGGELVELTPVLRRAIALDPAGLVRLRIRPTSATTLVRLPFGVLAGRRISGSYAQPLDATYGCAQLLAWLEGQPLAVPPESRDLDWRSGLPPEQGWRRMETVPDDVIRGLIAAGLRTLKEVAVREGVPDGQPRAEVTDTLLDSIVLTVEQGPDRVEISLRLLSALTRMAFLARGSHLAIDLAGRWLRVTASYGSVYAERPGLGLGILSVR
jgi:hypothetical protein